MDDFSKFSHKTDSFCAKIMKLLWAILKIICTFVVSYKIVTVFMMKDEIKKACEVMQKGGIILYPTDTVWGIGLSLIHI